MSLSSAVNDGDARTQATTTTDGPDTHGVAYHRSQQWRLSLTRVRMLAPESDPTEGSLVV
jgi:hypothetical protein